MAKRNATCDARGGGVGDGGAGGGTGGGRRFHSEHIDQFRGPNYFNLQNEFSDYDIPTRTKPGGRRFCFENEAPIYLPPPPRPAPASVPAQAEICQRGRLQQMQILLQQRQQRQNAEQSRMVAQGARMGSAADTRRQQVCAEQCTEQARADKSSRACPPVNISNKHDSDDCYACSDSDPSRDQSRGFAMPSPKLNRNFNCGAQQQSPTSPQFISIRNDSYSTGEDPTGDDELMNILCGQGSSPQGRMPRGVQNQYHGNGSGRGRQDQCFSESDTAARFNLADFQRGANRSSQHQSGFSQSRNECSDSDNRPTNLTRTRWDPNDPLGERSKQSRYGGSSREYSISPDRRGGSAAKALSYTSKGGAVCQLPCNIRQQPKRCSTCDISMDPTMSRVQQKSCDMAPTCRVPNSPQRGNYMPRQGSQALSTANRRDCNFQGQQQSAMPQRGSLQASYKMPIEGPLAISTPNRAVCDFQGQQQGTYQQAPTNRGGPCAQQQSPIRQSPPNQGYGMTNEVEAICEPQLPAQMTSTPRGRGVRTGYSPRMLMTVTEASDDSAEQNYAARNAYPCCDDFGAAAAGGVAAWNASRQRAMQSPGQVCEQPPPIDDRSMNAYPYCDDFGAAAAGGEGPWISVRQRANQSSQRGISGQVCEQSPSRVDRSMPRPSQEETSANDNTNEALLRDIRNLRCKLDQLQFEHLVADQFCPGIIQETINGCENFNQVAFDLVFGQSDLPDKEPAVGPLSLIEAFDLRIDYERCQVNQQKQQGELPSADTSIENSFRCKFKTELNEALQNFLKAEELYSAENPAAGLVTFDADINKTEVLMPSRPLKVQTFTGSTAPKQSRISE